MTRLGTGERSEALAGLLHVALQFESLGRRAIRAASGYDVRDGELRYLLALYEHPLSQAQLARRLQLDTGQTNLTVKRLMEKQLVFSLRHGPKPKQGYPLHLTELGRQKAADARMRHKGEIERLLMEEKEGDIVRLIAAAQSAGKLIFDVNVGAYVRDAAPGDIGAIMQIAADTIPTLFKKPLPSLEEYVARSFLVYKEASEGVGHFLIGEHWGEIAGGLLTRHDPDDGQPVIAFLVVKKLHLGRGVGTALIEALRGRLAETRQTKISAFALPDEEGKSLFASLGWTSVRSILSEELGSSLMLEKFELRL